MSLNECSVAQLCKQPTRLTACAGEAQKWRLIVAAIQRLAAIANLELARRDSRKHFPDRYPFRVVIPSYTASSFYLFLVLHHLESPLTLLIDRFARDFPLRHLLCGQSSRFTSLKFVHPDPHRPAIMYAVVDFARIGYDGGDEFWNGLVDVMGLQHPVRDPHGSSKLLDSVDGRSSPVRCVALAESESNSG